MMTKTQIEPIAFIATRLFARLVVAIPASSPMAGLRARYSLSQSRTGLPVLRISSM